MRWSLWYLNHRRIPKISSLLKSDYLSRNQTFLFLDHILISGCQMRILLRDEKLILWIVHCIKKSTLSGNWLFEKPTFRKIKFSGYQIFRGIIFSVIRLFDKSNFTRNYFFHEKNEFSRNQIFRKINFFAINRLFMKSSYRKTVFSKNQLFEIIAFFG